MVDQKTAKSLTNQTTKATAPIATAIVLTTSGTSRAEMPSPTTTAANAAARSISATSIAKAIARVTNPA